MVGTWMLCGNGWRLMWTLSWNLIWTLSWLAHVCSACSDVVCSSMDALRNDESLRKGQRQQQKTANIPSKCSRNGPSSIQRAKKTAKPRVSQQRERTNTTEKKCSKTHKENARCRPKLGNSNNENRPKQGVRAAGQPVGKNNQSGPSGQLHISDITTHQNLHKVTEVIVRK